MVAVTATARTIMRHIDTNEFNGSFRIFAVDECKGVQSVDEKVGESMETSTAFWLKQLTRQGPFFRSSSYLTIQFYHEVQVAA